MGISMRSTAEMRKHLRNHDISLGGRVASVFSVKAVTCCELDNGFLVGCQVAKEHGKIEVVLARLEVLPLRYTGNRVRDLKVMEFLLLGRKFRGLSGDSRTGAVCFDFGRYIIRFDRSSQIFVDRGIDRPETRDLEEDLRVSADDQFRHAQQLGIQSRPC